MMEATDRHFRHFIRLITRRTLLYTEMITANAIIHGNRDHLLAYGPDEHPIALQLGGDDPEQLASAVELAEQYGYDEYDLNVGCPSDRVQTGNFGASLMARPEHVRGLVAAMRGATRRLVTVKHRIGIDGRDSYADLRNFVSTVRDAAPARFIVHARIAVLEGLSPKENRAVPPLRYHDVYALKQEMPDLVIEINGGICTLEDIDRHLEHVDGVMIGRAAFGHPWIFRDVDQRYFRECSPPTTRREVITRMKEYCDQAQADGHSIHSLIRPLLELFAFEPGTRRFKQKLSGKLETGVPASSLLDAAVSHISEEVLDG
jgi:tRNA-dihydrouridine synthase A